MSNTKLNTTPAIDQLLTQWEEAKSNEKGWIDVRRDVEGKLKEHYNGFEDLLATISDKPVLSVSADLGDNVKVGVGYNIEVEQAGIVDFLGKHPEMMNILFKLTYKPEARAILKAIAAKGEIGAELEELIGYKPKTPSFSLR